MAVYSKIHEKKLKKKKKKKKKPVYKTKVGMIMTSEGGRLPATKKYKEMLKRKKVKRMKLKSK